MEILQKLFPLTATKGGIVTETLQGPGGLEDSLDKQRMFSCEYNVDKLYALWSASCSHTRGLHTGRVRGLGHAGLQGIDGATGARGKRIG